MYKISADLITFTDAVVYFSGTYTSLDSHKAIKQFTAHAHKVYGYKIYIRNLEVLKC